MSIKVLLADDHPIVREGIKSVIERTANDIEIVGEVSNGKEVLEIAGKYNIRIIGPNCIGVYDPHAGLFFGSDQSKKAGNFGGVCQSGGLAVNISSLAVSYGCYISSMIAVGNQIDLTHPDFLDYFNNDERTAIIGLYPENLSRHRSSGHQGLSFLAVIMYLSLPGQQLQLQQPLPAHHQILPEGNIHWQRLYPPEHYKRGKCKLIPIKINFLSLFLYICTFGPP